MTIDPEIRTFIADSARFYPADAATRSIAEQRQLYDAYARAFAVSRAPGLLVEDASLRLYDRSVPLRRYRLADQSPTGTIIYAHGGGFMLGSLDSHDGIVARIAARTGTAAIAVDYRLAPEHPAPAALDDVLAVIDAVSRNQMPWPDLKARPLVLVGDSAGATLVSSAALRLAGSEAVSLAGMALIYPMLGREPQPPARGTEAQTPMLRLADVGFYRDVYLAGSEPDPWTFVLDAPALEGLSPTFLLGAEHDPLRDDCTVLADRLRRIGIETQLAIGRGLLHGFLRALDRSSAAAEAFDRCVASITACIQAAHPG